MGQLHLEPALAGLGPLADDFEEWTPAPPGDPIAREDWLKHALDPGFVMQSSQIRQMAVRTVNDTEVVSFVESRSAVCGGRDCSSSSFIVDLWWGANGHPHPLGGTCIANPAAAVAARAGAAADVLEQAQLAPRVGADVPRALLDGLGDGVHAGQCPPAARRAVR